MTEYPWPGKPSETMPVGVIKHLSGIGVRYSDLLVPECWDCKAETREYPTGPTLLGHLKYEPYCVACRDKSFAKAQAEREKWFDPRHNGAEKWDREHRVYLMSLIRNPTTTAECRQLAREILASMQAKPQRTATL